jgi:hypothetical protein
LRLLRKMAHPFWRHPQAWALRPYEDEINKAKRRVIRDIIYSKRVDAHECPIPVKVYAAAEDNIVTRQSAQSVYPDADALPGDHNSVIQPDSRQHRSYKALKRNLELALAEPMPIGVKSRASIPGPIVNYLQAHPEFSLQYDIDVQKVSTSISSFTTAARYIYNSLESGDRVTAIDPFEMHGERPFFWVREGGYSYLRLNYEASLRGAEITRIFVVSRRNRIRYARILEGLRRLQALIGVRAGLVTYEQLPNDCRYEFAVFANKVVDLVTFDMFGTQIENWLLWSDAEITKFRGKADHITTLADIRSSYPPRPPATFDGVQEFAQGLRREIEDVFTGK